MRAISNARNNNDRIFTIILILTARQQPIFHKVLTDLNFADIDTLYWMKSTTNTGKSIPPNQRYVPAVEIIMTARSTPLSGNSRDYRPPSFDRSANDPLAKFNFFLGPDEQEKLKEHNSVVNLYQRPPWLASFLAKPYTRPGSQTVVFGAGLGGDVKGLLDIQCNVLAIEANEQLYGKLCNMMMGYEPKLPTTMPMTMADIASTLLRNDDYEQDERYADERAVHGDERCPARAVTNATPPANPPAPGLPPPPPPSEEDKTKVHYII